MFTDHIDLTIVNIEKQQFTIRVILSSDKPFTPEEYKAQADAVSEIVNFFLEVKPDLDQEGLTKLLSTLKEGIDEIRRRENALLN